MPIVFQKFIHRIDLVMNRKVTYVFGDNDKRAGWGGQAAECRGEANAHGIRTKKAPGKDPTDLYVDSDYAENCRKIDEDMAPLYEMANQNRVIVWPSDGVGTGYAKLGSNAPRTLKYIESQLDRLIKTAAGMA